MVGCRWWVGGCIIQRATWFSTAYSLSSTIYVHCHLVLVGSAAEGRSDAAAIPQTHHRPADDAGARVPEKGLHRGAPFPRERAAHVHPRGRAQVLDRRG